MGRLTESYKQRTIPGWSLACRRTRWVFALLICCFLHPRECSAQQTHPTESQVKAAYLYNFGKFVRWQVAAPGNDSFDICVLGKNPFGSALATTVAGEKIDGKPIAVKNIANPSEAVHCKILFISASEGNRLKAIFSVARLTNSLTVSDIPGFTEQGGMIELLTHEGRIRFQVNVAAINEAKLTVSSELLKVAVKVIGLDQAREMSK